jgi:hypothetical protein
MGYIDFFARHHCLPTHTITVEIFVPAMRRDNPENKKEITNEFTNCLLLTMITVLSTDVLSFPSFVDLAELPLAW